MLSSHICKYSKDSTQRKGGREGRGEKEGREGSEGKASVSLSEGEKVLLVPVL